jgi:uncharacterized protein
MTTLRRHLYLAGGWLSLSLAFLGLFLPLLPTTPFVLLAAACFSRGSDRLYRWLLAQPTFGPLLRDWQQHGMIRLRVKLITTVLMVLLLGYPIGYGSIPLWAKGAMALVGVSVLGFVWSRPSRDNS